MSCSLNLASCRLRAEALARQLSPSLWSPRSSNGSPAGSGSVSPCFGLPAGLSSSVVDRAPVHIPPRWMTASSLDEEEEGGDGLVLALTNGLTNGREPNHHAWRPDSPPESFASESESPALTLEAEEAGSLNSADTVSELASPTDEYAEDASPLADELRTRLQLIESCQSLAHRTHMTSPIEEVTEESSLSSTLSSDTLSRDLLSPPDCPRLVRSTSLKTGKTPPGTPSRKKIVRFADVLGLDLEAIRHFVKDDDAPIVPQSAFADLKITKTGLSPFLPWSISSPGLTQAGCRFVSQFEQPGSDPHFLDKVRQQKVCLENAILNDLRVTGVVRVLNLGFEKLVQVRYTTTEWAAHTDLTADYVPSSCDGFSDKFTFTLHLPHLSPGQRLLFALRYVANGQEFWDNNSGDNYVLKCQTKTEQESTAASNGPRWLHHFM